MPSALQQSRDFLARGVSRVRSGINRIGDDLDSPGPGIKVEPFDAQNVSTPAALIKLGTSIAAARREKANYGAGQRAAELETEKTRAEIANIRAQAADRLRDPAPAKPSAGEQVIQQGKYKGWTVADADKDLRDRGLNQSAGNASRRNANAGRVTAASKALADVEKRVETDSAVHAAGQIAKYEHIFTRAASPDEAVRHKALEALFINPGDYDNMPELEKYAVLRKARQDLVARVRSRAKQNVSKYFEPDRQKYRSVIEQGAAGFAEDETPFGAPEGSEELPFGTP